MKDDNDELREYEFERLLFGLNASPFLAQLVSSKNAEHFNEKYSRGVETILKSTYMDDTLDSVETVEDAQELQLQIIKIWEGAGMSAKKWITSSNEINQKIPSESRAKVLEINDGEKLSVKTLGVSWNAKDDNFSISTNFPDNCDKLTKRSFLSWLAKVFDPLGFVSPIVVIGKMIMQELWLKQMDWDDKIEGELEIKMQNWLEDCRNLERIQIPRCLTSGDKQQTELHIFVDASTLAYGAVVYTRSVKENIVKVCFVMSKTKVAPLKVISVPRLELMAALIGEKIARVISSAWEIRPGRSSSSTEGQWMKRPSRSSPGRPMASANCTPSGSSSRRPESKSDSRPITSVSPGSTCSRA